MIDQTEEAVTRTNPQAPEFAWLALRYIEIGQRRVSEQKERLKGYVSREPLKALGLALGAGVIVGWLIKRR